MLFRRSLVWMYEPEKRSLCRRFVAVTRINELTICRVRDPPREADKRTLLPCGGAEELSDEAICNEDRALCLGVTGLPNWLLWGDVEPDGAQGDP